MWAARLWEVPPVVALSDAWPPSASVGLPAGCGAGSLCWAALLGFGPRPARSAVSCVPLRLQLSADAGEDQVEGSQCFKDAASSLTSLVDFLILVSLSTAVKFRNSHQFTGKCSLILVNLNLPLSAYSLVSIYFSSLWLLPSRFALYWPSLLCVSAVWLPSARCLLC